MRPHMLFLAFAVIAGAISLVDSSLYSTRYFTLTVNPPLSLPGQITSQ
jgi:hypothetical protein